MSRRYRLPLPTVDWLPAETTLRASRIRKPLVLGREVDRIEALVSTASERGVGSLGEAEIPDEVDGVVWLPDADELRALDQPDAVAAFRRRLGDRRFLVIVSPDLETPAVRGLCEQGFSILRYDFVRRPEEAEGASEGTATDGESLWLLTKPDDYRIRTCREDDVEAILELFAPLFHVARTPEHWRWKYLENPWGKLWISLVETEDGELAAHYAGYPVPFVRWPEGAGGAREELRAEQIGDTMTVPEHRKAGVGWSSLLGRALRRHFMVFGHGRVDFYYGINNSKIRAFNLRIVGSRWLGSAGYRRRAAEFPCPSRPRGLEVRRVHPFDAGFPGDRKAEFDLLLDRAGPHYGLMIRKDSEWLRWRYAICPDEPSFFALAARHRDRLVGWAVFRPAPANEDGAKTLRLVDALFEPEHAGCIGPLIEDALRQPESAGSDQVACWFAPRPDWWVEALHVAGFERVSEPSDLGFIYLPFDRRDTDDFIFEYSYAWGDSDLT